MVIKIVIVGFFSLISKIFVIVVLNIFLILDKPSVILQFHSLLKLKTSTKLASHSMRHILVCVH